MSLPLPEMPFSATVQCMSPMLYKYKSNYYTWVVLEWNLMCKCMPSRYTIQWKENLPWSENIGPRNYFVRGKLPALLLFAKNSPFEFWCIHKLISLKSGVSHGDQSSHRGDRIVPQMWIPRLYPSLVEIHKHRCHRNRADFPKNRSRSLFRIQY